jgi:hypothetical protein
MLLDPRPGSLTGSSHVPGSGVRCDVGAGALAAKGVARNEVQQHDAGDILAILVAGQSFASL